VVIALVFSKNIPCGLQAGGMINRSRHYTNFIALYSSPKQIAATLCAKASFSKFGRSIPGQAIVSQQFESRVTDSGCCNVMAGCFLALLAKTINDIA